MIGGSDDNDIPLIIKEMEHILIKDVIDKIIKKEHYYLVYFLPVKDCVDRRISRFIYTIQHPTRYITIHYKNEEMKTYTYVKKAPYKYMMEIDNK
jgi:hypothetical protein